MVKLDILRNNFNFSKLHWFDNIFTYVFDNKRKNICNSYYIVIVTYAPYIVVITIAFYMLARMKC